MWYNKYVGIPYKDNGRLEEGADCWGLARLIYKQEYNIELPSLTNAYKMEDAKRIEELAHQYKEGWDVLETPEAGAIVLFRVLGTVSHVGIMINSTQFMHNNSTIDTCIESIDNVKWRHRVYGFFKYSEKADKHLTTLPAALTAIAVEVPVGLDLGEILALVIKENKLDLNDTNVIILIDGEIVEVIDNTNFIPKLGQKIEYRVIPAKAVANVLLTIVVVVAVMYFAPYLATTIFGSTAGAGAIGAGFYGAGMAAASSMAVYATTAVLMMAGMALVNAIAPIRPPDQPLMSDPGSSNPQLLLNGSRNSPRAYQSIPMVLGAYRIIAPLAAQSYLRVNDETSYLNLLLSWGYGPVVLEDMRVGAVPIEVYGPNRYDVLGNTGDNSDPLYTVYGKDTYQITPSLPLVYTNTENDWQYTTITVKCNKINITLHFPEGLRGVYREGDNAGKDFSTTFTGQVEYRSLNQNLAPTSGWNTINLNYGSSDYYKRKDAFSTNIVIPDLAYSLYATRVRRTNSTVSDLSGQGGKPILYHKAMLYLVTGIDGTTNPVVTPKNTTLAITALEIMATDQLNGSIDGINALVRSVCLDYTGTSWVPRTTSNPASLFRYILQHPANTQHIKADEVSKKIDLVAIQKWHTFCSVNGFEYNGVVVEQRSLLEVLRDVCAAGRASPLLLGGKWTVIVDEPRDVVVQHFTPHNSWGFEGTRTLANMPDALRVTFINAAKEFQSEEIMVYSDGFSESNAALFEALQLPGVTNAAQAYKLARFHLAQAKLRPESYTFNADMEHMACNRGDLVRVSHDVPMWGTGTGRISSYLNATTLHLDEEVLLDSNTDYVIRIRTDLGDSILRSIVRVATQNYYSNITVTVPISEDDGKAGNLFMIGTSELESVELVVISIQPSTNLTAKINLVDYSPVIYDIASGAIPDFQTKITRPSTFARNFIISVPVITPEDIRSDESVMERSGTSYIYKISVPYKNAGTIEPSVTGVEARMCLTQDTSLGWTTNTNALLASGLVLFSSVVDKETYSIQLRYTSTNGFAGPWSEEIVHTVVGQVLPPANVSSGIRVVPEGNVLRITWPNNPEIDISGYEVRDVEAAAGSPGTLFSGSSNTCLVTPGPLNISKTWYIKAVRGNRLYSTDATPVSFTVLAPYVPTNITSMYTNDNTALFKWTAALPGTFAIRNYRLSLTGVGFTTIEVIRDTTDWEIPITWVNAVTLAIIPVDMAGYMYTGQGNTTVLPIGAPSVPATPTITISGTNIEINFPDNAVDNTQIPVTSYTIVDTDTGEIIWKSPI